METVEKIVDFASLGAMARAEINLCHPSWQVTEQREKHGTSLRIHRNEPNCHRTCELFCGSAEAFYLYMGSYMYREFEPEQSRHVEVMQRLIKMAVAYCQGDGFERLYKRKGKLLASEMVLMVEGVEVVIPQDSSMLGRLRIGRSTEVDSASI